MPSTKGDVVGLHELATFLANQGNALASRAPDVATGASFQPTARAISDVHGSVTAAQEKLVERMAATSARVRAASRDYANTENASVAALRSMSKSQDG